MRLRFALVLFATSFAAVACSDADLERRAKDAAQRMKDSIPDVHARALVQEAPTDRVELAQRALANLREYQGEVNGKLDRVTINAIQAFQRAHSIEDHGLLDDPTMQTLQAALPPQ